MKEPKLDNFQQQVSQFVQEYQLEAPVSARVLDLVSELGELSKEVLKGLRPFAVPTHQRVGERTGRHLIFADLHRQQHRRGAGGSTGGGSDKIQRET